MKICEICLIVYLAILVLIILLCFIDIKMKLKDKIVNFISQCFKGKKDVDTPDPDGIIGAVRDAKVGLKGDFNNLKKDNNDVCDNLKQLNNEFYDSVDHKFSNLEKFLRKGSNNKSVKE